MSNHATHRQSTWTFEEIIRNEDMNESRIYLHRKGIFYQMYNQSAFLFYRHVKEFKVSCHLVKKYNRTMWSIGVPSSSIKKYLRRMQVTELDGDGVLCAMTPYKVNDIEYQQWEDVARVNLSHSERYTRVTRLIESQDVYKTAWDLLMDVISIRENVDKRLEIIGNDALMKAYTLAKGVRDFYDSPDRKAAAQLLAKESDGLCFALYVLNTRKQCSDDKFSICNERAASVAEQLSKLVKPSKPAPAPTAGAAGQVNK